MGNDFSPLGVPVIIGGEERRFLFTFNLIAELQQDYESPVFDVLKSMIYDGVNEYNAVVVIDVVHKLLEDEIEYRKFIGDDTKLKRYTRKQVGWLITNRNVNDIFNAVLQAWGYSMPDPKDEDENPNLKSGQ